MTSEMRVRNDKSNRLVRFSVEVTKIYDVGVDVEQKASDIARLIEFIYDSYGADSVGMARVSEAFVDMIKEKMAEE